MISHSSTPLIALEEHFTAPGLTKRIDPALVAGRGFRPRSYPAGKDPTEKLADIGEGRIQEMDRSGVSLQVLSHGGPGADLVPGADGIQLAREINDHLASAIGTFPDRLAGFAHLPMRSPEAAATELSRCVQQHGFVGAMIDGTTEGRFLDHASYNDLLACAAELDVPIYIHPHLPPEAVRVAYYSDLPGSSGRVLETAGWGWHSETAIHVLRLVVSGTLDRHRGLKLIIGHMGEMLPVMLARADDYFTGHADHLDRSISAAILSQVWITTSGIFTDPPLSAALQTFGADRIMFSVDYPFAENDKGVTFLANAGLSEKNREKIAYGNARDLLGLVV